MEAYGTTAFCDDIRTEIDGRTTLIGVYKHPLIVPQFPFTIPKLGFAISVVIPRDEVLSDVQTVIFTPGDVDAPSYRSQGNLYEAMDATKKRDALVDIHDPDVITPFHVWLNLLFSPVTIMQEGYFKVRFLYNDKVLKVGALRVENKSRNIPIANIVVPTAHQVGKPTFTDATPPATLA